MYIPEKSKNKLVDFILIHKDLSYEGLNQSIRMFDLELKGDDPFKLLIEKVLNLVSLRIIRIVSADRIVTNQEICSFNDIFSMLNVGLSERSLNKQDIEEAILNYAGLDETKEKAKELLEDYIDVDLNKNEFLLYRLYDYISLTIIAIPNFDFYFIAHYLFSQAIIDVFKNDDEAMKVIEKDTSIITTSIVDIIDNLKTKIPDLYNEKISNCSIYNELKDKKVLYNNIIDNSQESVNGILTDVDPIEELNSLIGLDVVKNDVNELINLLKINKIKKERGISTSNLSLHMVFSGNPGTGKTTVARLIAKIYHKLGILSKGHLVETDRAGLVGGYVGQTAIKTKDVVESAIGGVLFIDEAYTLSNARFENDYGKEAIETILKLMEDNRENLVVIVAGYTDLMKKFVDINPGLSSRFNKYIYFEDYNEDELLKIFNSIAQKHGQIVEDAAQDYLIDYFQKRIKNEKFANARDVRNYYEKVQIKQANRLVNNKRITNEDLIMIKLEDVKDIQL